MRIALFVTCLADTLFPDVGRATVTVLERLGHDVVFPPDQTCCGQMHTNTGYADGATRIVRHHVEVFERALDDGAEAIVTPSGSCAGSVRHQHVMLAQRAGDADLARRDFTVNAMAVALPDWKAPDAFTDLYGRAARVAAATFELSELLVDRLGVTDVGASYPHRVTYHPTCHSLRLLRVGEKPLQLLRAVRGIDLVELDGADQCCGFGGTFAVKNAETSTAMLADKMSAVLATDAETNTVTVGSRADIGGGLARLRTGVRSVHLAEVLAATEGAVTDRAVDVSR